MNVAQERAYRNQQATGGRPSMPVDGMAGPNRPVGGKRKFAGKLAKNASKIGVASVAAAGAVLGAQSILGMLQSKRTQNQLEAEAALSPGNIVQSSPYLQSGM